MGFAKAFFLSLVAFISINFLFVILSSLINNTLDTVFSVLESAPLMILYYLFGSITVVPSESILIMVDFDVDTLISPLGYLLAPLIAAILSGRLGENKGQAIGGWLLTAVISAGAIIIGVFLSGTIESILGGVYGTTSQTTILINVAISLFINFVGFGFFALLVSKTEYY
ncbi:hypothetical protein LCGC14_2432230 [marine sediment metagenome]|uniref:Uncharacterized protein n=1 Tax=marine sediment metagenome TaxID=412755 RepID=A0A0F9DYK6_9ZZZZ